MSRALLCEAQYGGADNMMDGVAKQGSPWLFGLEPESFASLLEPFHLCLLTDAGSADYQANYFKLFLIGLQP